MKNQYEFTFDSGHTFLVEASSRGDAIEKFCNDRGCSSWWVVKHAKIKNLGVIASAT